MDNTPHNDLVIPSANPDDGAPEEILPTPHFDEKAIQQARPAVPLEQIKARILWLTIALMFSSALLGAVMALAVSRYQNGTEQASTRGVSSSQEESRVSSESGSDRIVKSTNPAEPLSEPVHDKAEKVNELRPRTAQENTEATRVARPRDDRAGGSEPFSDTQDDAARATLQGALDEWIAATNARDVQRQMGFYNQKVNAFYLTRNVPREAVLAEKSRVFGRAQLIDIKAAAPGIRVSRDGRTATMRFRKKYAIEGGGEDRRGEVLQELRWQRTDDGWKIVSERDLRVIN